MVNDIYFLSDGRKTKLVWILIWFPANFLLYGKIPKIPWI